MLDELIGWLKNWYNEEEDEDELDVSLLLLLLYNAD